MGGNLKDLIWVALKPGGAADKWNTVRGEQ